MIVPPVPSTRSEDIDFSLGLFPNLGTGKPIVTVWIVLVLILVCIETVRCLRREPLCDRIVAPRIARLDRRRANDDFRTERPQARHLFGAHLVWHHEYALITPNGRNHRKACPRITARSFDDRSTGFELSTAFCLLDHVKRHPVFHRARGIQVLAFHIDGGFDIGRNFVELDERCIANRFEMLCTAPFTSSPSSPPTNHLDEICHDDAPDL